MARIAKADMHRIIESAARAIREADRGADGIVSREDMGERMEAMRYFDQIQTDEMSSNWNGGLADMMEGMNSTRAELVETFFRFIDHRDYEPGARITDSDIDKAVEYAKDKLVDAYDVNNNGLSQSEVDEMGRIGNLSASLVKQSKAFESRMEFVGTKIEDLYTKQDALQAAVEQKDWDAVYALFDPEVRTMQESIGMGRDQFIIEALGFNRAGGPDVNLNNLERLEFNSKNGPVPFGPDSAQLSVTVTLKDGTSADGSVLLNDPADAMFSFTSAVG